MSIIASSAGSLCLTPVLILSSTGSLKRIAPVVRSKSDRRDCTFACASLQLTVASTSSIPLIASAASPGGCRPASSTGTEGACFDFSSRPARSDQLLRPSLSTSSEANRPCRRTLSTCSTLRNKGISMTFTSSCAIRAKGSSLKPSAFASSTFSTSTPTHGNTDRLISPPMLNLRPVCFSTCVVIVSL